MGLSNALVPEEQATLGLVIGVYARISADTEGLGLGVQRQVEDCQKLADLRKWSVGPLFVDNDLSAFKPAVKRPQFEKLLDELASGRLDGVVVYDLDRFARQPSDLERAIRIFDSRPLVFATVQGDIDLSTPDGRTMARVLVAFANKASMDTSRRVSRKHEELRMKGVVVGATRGFGYQDDKVSLHPDEAALIRTAAQDIITGYPLHGIARRWNTAGVRTPYGNLWVQPVVKYVFTNPSLAGYRTYKRKIVRDPDGKPVMANRPPILDIPTWEAVQVALSDPSRYNQRIHRGARKRFLSGMCRCGICGKVMQSDFHSREQIHIYVCKAPTSRGGCGKIAVSGPRVDEAVEWALLRKLEKRRIEPQLEPWDGEAELETVTARIAELMASYTSGELSGNVAFPAVKKLELRQQQLKASRAAWMANQMTAIRQPDNIIDTWDTLDFEQKRLILETLIESVEVKPAAKKGGRFDPDRLKIIWNDL